MSIVSQNNTSEEAADIRRWLFFTERKNEDIFKKHLTDAITKWYSIIR